MPGRDRAAAARLIYPAAVVASGGVTFSVIVPTRGRSSLAHTLTSIAAQLEDGDEVLVMRNNDDDFGSTARNSAMDRARGTHLLFIDDDDEYLPGALAAMRRFAVEHPDRIGIFRMRYWRDGRVLWDDAEFRFENIGTPMFVVPNVEAKLGRWEPTLYAADWRFISETVTLQGPPLFREAVVAVINPDRRPALTRYADRVRGSGVYLRSRVRARTRLRGLRGR